MLLTFVQRLARSAPRRFLVAVIIIAVLGLADGLGAALLILVLQALGIDMQGGGVGRIGRALTSAFQSVGVRPGLAPTLAIFLAVMCGSALLSRWQTLTTFRIQADFVLALRRRLYTAITYTNWAFYSRKRSSDVAHALTVESNRVGLAVQYLLQFTSTAVLALAYLALALLVSWQASVLVLATGALLVAALRSQVRLSRHLGQEFSQASEDLHAAVSEHLAGMKLVRGHNSQEGDIGVFARISARLRDVYLAAIRKQASVKAWFDIGTAVMLAAILLAGRGLLNLTAGTLLILLFLFARLVPRFSTMQQQYQLVASTLPALETIDRIEAECAAAAEPMPVTARPIELARQIRFDRVAFSYEREAASFALAEITLTISAGRTTAIVGPSGAGKTTIVDLLMGLLIPTSGTIRVDGVPLTADRLASWRSQLGYVDQETFLFHDTLRANLLFARPGASEEELGDALRLAAADEFVDRLPQGLDTPVGDRGVRLSGGQRQRLALARALLRKPALLILDEATSELDYESEQRIWTAIEALHFKTTILVITHRLALVKGADVIHVIDGGRLVESGDWRSLTADTAGRLVALWQSGEGR